MQQALDTITQQNNAPTFDLAGQLCERYKNRGIVKEIAQHDMEFKSQLEKTASSYPSAYMLSSADERTIDVKYRSADADGNRYMNTDGFVRYFNDCRRASDRKSTSVFVDADYAKRDVIPSPVSMVVSAKDMKSVPTGTIEKVGRFVSEWIKPDRERRGASYSSRPAMQTWLSVVVVFISFMLIVASSIMVGVETGNVSEMRNELTSLEDEKAELELELEVKNDLLSIYEVATEELGMVSENSVSVKYLPESEPSEVKNFDEDDNGRIDLATILSAIGIRR